MPTAGLEENRKKGFFFGFSRVFLVFFLLVFLFGGKTEKKEMTHVFWGVLAGSFRYFSSFFTEKRKGHLFFGFWLGVLGTFLVF